MITVFVSNPPPRPGQNSNSPPQIPPPYVGYQDYPGPQGQAYPQTIALMIPQNRRSPGLRFVHAFLVAIFIWSVFSLVVHSSVNDVHWPHHRHWDLVSDLVREDWDYTIPSHVSLEECVQGGEWSPFDHLSTESSGQISFPYRSETSFVLPLSSETLFFVSRGQKLVGAVDVVTSKEQAEGSATVRVEIKYHREDVRDLAKACLLSRKEGENGVGFFTPVWRSGRAPRGREYELGYNMTIILPEASGFSSPLTINNFETDVHNTAQSIHDPEHKLFFPSILLGGTNGPILAHSLTATKANLLTTNGPIIGTFNTTDTLTLVTSNSPIIVSVGLESEKADSTPAFIAQTSNSPLNANISLTSTSSSGSGGVFTITTTTSNSPLHVAFPASPLDSRLYFSASTSNSPARVSLHPAYEGIFKLKTSIFGVSVRQNAGVQDPSGKERERQVRYKGVGRGVREVIGEVYWDEERKEQGVVNVRSSNSPVVLEV